MRGKAVLALLCFVQQTVTTFLVLGWSLFFDSEKAVKQGWRRSGGETGLTRDVRSIFLIIERLFFLMWPGEDTSSALANRNRF